MAAPSLPFAPAPQPMDWRPPTPWRPTELPSSAPLLPRISSLLKPQQVNKRKLSTQEEQVAPLQPTGRGTSPRVVMFMPPNDRELLRIRRPSPSSRDWEHYTPPSASSPFDAAPTVSSAMRRAVHREFNPRQIAPPLSTAQESGLDARNRVRPTPTDVSSRYLQPPGPIRTQETAERRRLFYHHDMDPHKIHEIHVPAEMPPYRQVDAEMPRKQARTSRYQVAASHTRPVFYEEEPMDIPVTGQKRRRVAPSLAAPTHPRQPLYEGEYGLTVLETAKPLMRSRYSPLLERTAESGVLAARRRYARSNLEKFGQGDRPTSAGSRSSTESAGVARICATEKKVPPATAAPRAPAKADAPSLTTLVLKSKEFLKSTSLVRNRHDEIDWVATFLNVGFDSSSIYALMCPLRKGRWKSEEENYTMGLLKLIENGTILLRHGQSIRGYIGQKLHSDDMRVLKKLSNCKMFHFAKLINPRLAEDEKLDMEMAGAKEGLEHLDQLKGDFLRSVQLEALVAVRKYLSDSSLRDLLNRTSPFTPPFNDSCQHALLKTWFRIIAKYGYSCAQLSPKAFASSTGTSTMKRAEASAKSDGVDPSTARKCTFKLQIDAAVEIGAFEAPGFRFRFLDGSRKQTNAIGLGHGWTPLQDSESVESASALPPVFRFEQSFADIAISETFAVAIDDDPILSFFLFDHPGLAGSGATPRKEMKPSTAKTAGAPAATLEIPAVKFTPKAFAGLYEMDISSLLSGALHVKQTWASSLDADDPACFNDNLFGAKRPASEIQQSSQSLCLLPTAAGLQYLSIQVTVDQPLLTGELLKKLNPLTITVGAARQLPGAISQGIGIASPHSPLHRYCKPVFALIHFFPDQLRPSTTLEATSVQSHSVPRLLLTPGRRQSETARWNASVTLLCGRFEALELVDAIRFAALTVEIRDRDLKQEETLARYQLKWESLYTTGVDPGQQQDAGATTSSHHSPRATDATHPTGSTPPDAVKPMELSVVDDIARSDWRMLLANAGRLFPYGLAKFRLAELLNTAKQRMGGMKVDTDRPYLTIKLTTDIIAMKRRASPLGTATLSEESELPATVDLSSLEKVIREPGAYVSTGASLSIHVTLQSPIEIVHAESTSLVDTENPASIDDRKSLKFSRMVLIIPYKDDVTLGEVTKAMATINLKALPGVPIRSYQMSETEKMDCESGALDVITGTQIIDSQYRMIILEGLADNGMKYMHEQLQRKGPNDPQGYRMFCNDEIRFTRRLYTNFEIDLKRIKLRYPLPLLMTTPDIYMRAKVSENCHQALARLTDMRQVQRLIEVKHLDLFPTAQMLLEVESKYGESITLEDIHGKSGGKSSVVSHSEPNNATEEAKVGGHTGVPTSHRANKLKAPTDATNASFEQSCRSRVEKNFILERKKHSNQLHAEYLEKKQVAEMLGDKSQAPVYLYSGQKLRTQDILQEKQRERLSKDRHATYTYSSNFQSLALSMVNPEALRQTEEQENRKKWTTQRGFIYPAPRQPVEYYKHAHTPSEARCEDLRQPFVDNINHPKPVSRESGDPGSRKGPEFSTLPSKDMVFGGTNGDGTVNPEYFKSVHLCGEGLRLEMEEALKREQEEWERRLVVDKKQLKFLAHGNICSLPREKPSQLDKISDILRGPAQSKPIRIVKNASLPSGKRVPLEKAPVTIHNQQEYAGCVAATFASTLRPSDSNQFVATDVTSGTPKDFFFPSTTSILTPPVKKFITRKEIIPVRETEKRGPIWRNE